MRAEEQKEALKRIMADGEEERARRAERLQKMEEENVKIEENYKLSRENKTRLDEETHRREQQQRHKEFERLLNDIKIWNEEALANVSKRDERNGFQNKGVWQQFLDLYG
jgi:hypothetical protein